MKHNEKYINSLFSQVSKSQKMSSLVEIVLKKTFFSQEIVSQNFTLVLWESKMSAPKPRYVHNLMPLFIVQMAVSF